MKKILFVTPHLSTGGLPQYLLRKVELLKDKYICVVVEYDCISPHYTVQRKKIEKLCPFYSLEKNKFKLLDIIKLEKPDIIHFEEIPETYMDNRITKEIYKKDREYLIIETTHSANYSSDMKYFMPDRFVFVSQLNYDQFKDLEIPSSIVEYEPQKMPRADREAMLKHFKLDPKKKHILNVGLFTPGKNQGYIFEIARLMSNDYQFHFVGNMAPNFREYWEPLQRNKPANCILWGEKSNVEKFYASMDMFIFASTYENNPIVLKEAMAYDMPVLMNNLDHYSDTYKQKFGKLLHLSMNAEEDAKKIVSMLKFEEKDSIEKAGLECMNDALNEISEKFKFPKRAFITHTTENYLDATKGLVDSICEFSHYPIVVYTVNFETEEWKDNSQVIVRKFETDKKIINPKFIEQHGNKYIDREDDAIYNILTLKPSIMLEAFKDGLKEGVYLDGDMIANYNVDDLYSYLKDVSDYPLVTRSVFDILIGPEGEHNIEKHLMQKLSVRERSMFYVATNTIVFNDDCKEFITQWKQTCDREDIRDDWKRLAPYHEETIINVLFWRMGYTKQLPLSYINIKNKDFVFEFFKFDDSDKSKYLDHMQGFPFYVNGVKEDWTWIPYDKNLVKVFHGLKEYDEAKKVIEIIKKNKK